MASAAMVDSMRAKASKRRAVVQENTVLKGHRLLLHLTLAMVTSTVLALVSLMGFKATGANCVTEPVALRSWLACMGAFETLSCLIFFVLHCSMAEMLSMALAGERAGGSTPAAPAAVAEPDLQGEGTAAPTAGVVGPQQSGEPSSAPQPAAPPQMQPAAAQPAEVAGSSRPHPASTALTFSSLIMLVTGFLAIWCIFGVLSTVDDVSTATQEECGQGSSFVLWLSIVGFVQVFLCHFWALIDTHIPGNRPEPQPTEVSV